MKKGTLLALISVVGLLSFNLAFAVGSNGVGQTLREEVQEKKQEVKTAVQALRHAKAVAKCDIVTNRINKKITNFDHQRDQHVASYNKTKEKIQNLITKLEAKGYDVTKLKADLVTFESKITKFETDYAQYVTLLKATETDTCGKSEGEFRTSLKAARDQLKLVHDDSVEIRTFYAKTIRPDVLALKAQKPESTTDADTTNDTTNTTEQ